MMAILVLFVLVLIVFQISISTSTDARIARNQTTIANMDLAIESVLLQIFEDLKADGEAGAAAGSAAVAGQASSPEPGIQGGAGGGGPTDSSQDDWARPGRYEINELTLRILFQDEDSKFNVLNLLTPDEDEARKAHERVIRILDLCREGTSADIDSSKAEDMADAMLEHMQRRENSVLPRPKLVTDDEENAPERGLPMSLREFVVLEPFDESHFRDFRDEEGAVVHSITSFLTLWTSLTTKDAASQPASATPAPEPSPPENPLTANTGAGGDPEEPLSGSGEPEGVPGQEEPVEGGEPGETGARAAEEDRSGGVRINVNRAPRAVLHALMDDREVPSYFWDRIVEYRNEEDEEAQDSDEEPVYDEFDREVVVRKIFRSVEDLVQIDGWEAMEPIAQAEVRQLLDVKSQVFSIFVTARRRTGEGEDLDFKWDQELVQEDEERGLDLVRTVRCIVWRRQGENEIEILPLERREVLDYVPFEVLDFPGEDR